MIGLVACCRCPEDIKAFYMRLNEDNRTVAAMDVLAPQIGEASCLHLVESAVQVIGGSQREERPFLRRLFEVLCSEA